MKRSQWTLPAWILRHCTSDRTLGEFCVSNTNDQINRNDVFSPPLIGLKCISGVNYQWLPKGSELSGLLLKMLL